MRKIQKESADNDNEEEDQSDEDSVDNDVTLVTETKTCLIQATYLLLVKVFQKEAIISRDGKRTFSKPSSKKYK